MDFSGFECDHCGACCGSLIIEASWYDALREPRLLEVSDVDRAKLRSGENCIVLWDAEKKSCPFLEDNRCSIYPTRPMACVVVEAGDAKCQQARRQEGIGLLCDRNGREPFREFLEASCNEYEIDIELVLGERHEVST